MEEDLQLEIGTFLMLSCALVGVNKRRKPKQKPRVVKNFQKSRHQQRRTNLIPRLRQHPEIHFEHFRMNQERFDKLLGIVGPHLQKYSFNTPVSPSKRLSLTLRYLATGLTMRSLASEYHVSRATVSNSIAEVCQILWKQLQPMYMPAPSKESWKQIAFDFHKLWAIPNCVGALDGKHVQMKCQNISKSVNLVSEFQNIQTFNMVLLATCDAHLCFSIIDVCCNCQVNDRGVLSSSEFGKRLKSGLMDLPEPSCIPGTNHLVPHFFASDEAFPLEMNIMRPFPGNNLSSDKLIYNYRLSRAHMLVENAFGVLAARWRILQSPIHSKIESIENIIKAICILHNFIMIEDRVLSVNDREYCPTFFVDHEIITGEHRTMVEGEWRKETADDAAMHAVHRVGTKDYDCDSAVIRNKLMEYFVSKQGSLPWQRSHVACGI